MTPARRFVIGLAVAAAGAVWLSAQAGPARPDPTRFTPVTVIEPGELDEPMAFEVLPGGKVYVIERKGALKVYDPATKRTRTVETLPVNIKYWGADGTAREAEEGLMGLTLDPKFAENRFIYLLYADTQVTKHVLARWTINEFDELDPDSKQVILEWGTQREICCHTGGGMAWDRDGNLLITVGDNTGVNLTAHTDERPGRQHWDDQHTAANTNDLRGKILRIHPEPNGTYTIPAGNLFPPGTPRTRPEIYAMGVRNPWRIFVDSATGWIYWSEVGPDALEDNAATARGYDEFNQAKAAGNYGWPYFIGANGAFPYFNYATNTPGPKQDPARPLNDSVNNTGVRELPPAVPALIYYPYAMSEKFPELGTGARSATGGPIFHKADVPKARRLFPEYYEGKWIIGDLSRGLIMAVTLTAEGAYAGMERLLPSYRPVEPIDMKFGPDGDLYVLEYGSNWFRKSDNTRLVRIEYNAGNRAPVARATANTLGGAAPLKVQLTGTDSRDPDGDVLKYSWSVEPESGGPARTFTTPDASVTFDRNGVYFATLTVTDPAGKTGEQLLTIVAGNEPPSIGFEIPGNRTFYVPGQPLKYAVTVRDKEDGVAPDDRVAFSIDRVADTFDVSWLAQGDAAVDAGTRFAVAKALINQSDCKTCHNVDSKSQGPSWTEIAAKYAPDPAGQATLVDKIRSGGTGVWGQSHMPAHPGLSVDDAQAILTYVMHIKSTAISATPLAGTYALAGGATAGQVIFRAVYTDKGVAGPAPLVSHTVERVAVRRSPVVRAVTADQSQGMTLRMEANGGVETMAAAANGYLVFRNIDLTGIRELRIMAQAPNREGFKGGTLEVRLGGLAGDLVGQATIGSAGMVASDANAAQTAGRAPTPGGGPAPAVIPLRHLAGVRDIWLVARNFSARPTEPVLSITSITFVQ